MIRTTFFFLFLCLLSIHYGWTKETPSIRNLIEMEEAEIDFTYWSLVIAKTYDPNVDIQAYTERIDALVEAVRKGLPDNSDEAKVMLTHTVLYQSGFWNQGQVHSYNLADPLGKDSRTRLLSYYLDTRKGNCVSMPTLMMAVLDKLDPSLQIYGGAAPLHLFLYFDDRQTGNQLVLETTQGTISYDHQYLINNLGISETSLESGLYLRKLSKKEFLGELATILIEKERSNGNFDQALKYADLVLTLAPKSAVALVQKAAILHEQGYQIQQYYKKTGTEPGSEEMEKLVAYKEEGDNILQQARDLGWRPQSAEEVAAYLESVKAQK
jgi:regulator of sirC expression with transglutaminase-like and TPR domain